MQVKELKREMELVGIIYERDSMILDMQARIIKLEEELKNIKKGERM